MNIVLGALNAKYIHSSLALRCLKSYAGPLAEHIAIREYTINHKEEQILQDIYKQKPDVVCFSCYIWNIAIIRRLIGNIKKILPYAVVVLGGPEVSYEAEQFLNENEAADIIIRGEGEKTFYALLCYFLGGQTSLKEIQGITYKTDSGVVSNPPQMPIALEDIPFVYEKGLEGLEHKILYYETQRGCPYECQYCLSSIEKGVRFLPEERVKKDILFFLDHNVPQVKFVDRTFNCSKNHAIMIWRTIMAHDNGITNFHMEITADIMDDEMIDIISRARPGLFQFEIGVQSTNEKTIKAIKRNTNFKKCREVVKKIKNAQNIHQHLDLIAGLPYEDYASFRNSFNDVYDLLPEQFQLGFLKLLKGSGLRKDALQYGICYRNEPVYEVLYTKELPYEHVLKLKQVEEMIELYYNSKKTGAALGFCVLKYPTPFDFYEAFGQYWQTQGLFEVQHNKIELYTIFYEFAQKDMFLSQYSSIICELLKFDLFLMDAVKTLPEYMKKEEGEEIKHRKRNFYQTKENIARYLPEYEAYTPAQISRMCHIELFSFDVAALAKSPQSPVKWGETAVLFQYKKKEILQGYAAFYTIEI